MAADQKLIMFLNYVFDQAFIFITF